VIFKPLVNVIEPPFDPIHSIFERLSHFPQIFTDRLQGPADYLLHRGANGARYDPSQHAAEPAQTRSRVKVRFVHAQP
jgi:hypothetical protein